MGKAKAKERKANAGKTNKPELILDLSLLVGEALTPFILMQR
jgi:hypothetical protein